MWQFFSKENLILTLCYIMVFLCIYTYNHLVSDNADASLFERLYRRKMPFMGVNTSSFRSEIPGMLETALYAVVIVFISGLLMSHFEIHPKMIVLILSEICICAFIFVLFLYAGRLRIFHYLKTIGRKTSLYETAYADPSKVKISFPEKKRNLIYIYMESMETGFCDNANGGGAEDNMIPELTKLAKEGIDFSDSEHINGAYDVLGATFTEGAMAAHFFGVPLNRATSYYYENTESDDYKLLPGLTGLGDILNSEGYNQSFLIGSDISIDGRDLIMRTHSFEIYDYNKALARKDIPEDYYAGWGFEDCKLIDAAKKELLNLSSQDKPFNLTLLTSDTHTRGSYKCEKCKSDFEDAYANIISCSSALIGEFVEWIKNQDFYSDTTVVIVGDHTNPNSKFIKRELTDDVDRKVFVSYLNLPNTMSDFKERKRIFTTLDLFPTTITSLGAKIDGERLGLGSNLFSDVPTLIEENDIDWLNDEFIKRSDKYNTFIKGY